MGSHEWRRHDVVMDVDDAARLFRRTTLRSQIAPQQRSCS
jgi:hypothetical protein